jgi:type IV pilus assembly protein PilV
MRLTRATRRCAVRGALLLEALAAIAVFSLGILGHVALMGAIARHVEDAHCRTEAVHLAQALLARMGAENPAALAGRYGAGTGGDGYAAFERAARRMPGAEIAGNAPEIAVLAGPTPESRTVTVTLRWQLPGERVAHRFQATAVVGGA